ncbi:MAG: response regulator [Oscillospiraceae bacterium]|jgi:signal transduction histidine kinase|nr:response regulator [Oscillospiraceae bacterium]
METIEKNKILIADDDLSGLLQLSHILQPEYTVYTAKDGVTALEIANSTSPDLILLDIVMPGMSGFEVLKELKNSEITKNIPVIFITGMSDSYNESEGFSMGAVDYIRKPYNDMVVMLRVRHQIRIVNLQRNLSKTVEIADAANKSKSDFLARMSHEIRTPLNVILGLSDSQLQNDDLSQEMTEVFTGISNAGELLLSVINDILDMNKIEAGVLELISAEYDVASCINDTILLNSFKYKEKPIEFIINVDENIPSLLIGDELRIKQVLNNILSNAFKYTQDGEVEFSVVAEVEKSEETADDTVTLVFTVRDTGCGMDPKQLEKLFDEYVRFSSESNLSVEGAGLGMNIAWNLVNMMDGNISAQSLPGKGSSVSVRLPQVVGSGDVIGKKIAENLKHFHIKFMARRKKTQIKRTQMPNGSVLIVDDNKTNIAVATTLLKLYGLQIDTAISGQETIDKIKDGKVYDIIFMDHWMIGMDGIEATDNLRKLGYDKPIVMLTANTIIGQTDEQEQGNFDAFLLKPIDMSQLDTVLNKYIRDKA